MSLGLGSIPVLQLRRFFYLLVLVNGLSVLGSSIAVLQEPASGAKHSGSISTERKQATNKSAFNILFPQAKPNGCLELSWFSNSC